MLASRASAATHLVHVHRLIAGADEVDGLAPQRLVVAVREVQARGAVRVDVLALLHQATMMGR